MGTDSTDILERLLHESVDVNDPCGDRQEVALHLACVIGSAPAVRLLLAAGADINARTVYSENALWVAAWKGHADVAAILVRNNIELDVSSNGWQVCCTCRSTRIVVINCVFLKRCYVMLCDSMLCCHELLFYLAFIFIHRLRTR